ncbi:MAG: hypothetical protein ACXWF8_11290 [Methylobacter sp.]
MNKATLTRLQEKFEALTQREKIIVVFAILAGLWTGWDNFFYQPIQKQQQELEQKLASLKQQTADQQLLAIKLENTPRTDPNLDNRNRLNELKAEYKRTQEQVMNDKSLVPPKLMATALGDILSKNDQLKLIKLNTLPATTLLEATPEQTSPIYKHGLEITFSGNYLDTLNYLKALEALPWHFVWESLDYKVAQYPIAETTITVYTLSFKESWLGV